MLSKEVNTKISEAVESNRYLITISHHDGQKLHHYWVTNDFLDADLIPSLDQLRKDLSEKKLSEKWE